jgi:hypothetical protein
LIHFDRPGDHAAVLKTIAASLATIIANEEKIMSALTDLQAADTALKTEVATFLTDVATALTNAGTDPAAIEAVVTDINTEVAGLTAADPVTGTTPA